MRIVAAPVAVVGALALGAALLPLSFPVEQIGYFLVRAGAAAFAWSAATRWPAGRQLLPVLVATGLTTEVLGDVVYAVHEAHGLQGDASWADLPYFVTYACLGGALLLPARHASRRQREEALLDVLTIATVAVVLLWSPVLSGIVSDPSRSALVRSVLVAYPLADVLLLAVVARVMVTGHGRFLLGWAFVAGVLAWFAASLHRVLSPEVADWRALAGWLLGSVLMAASTRPRSAVDDVPPVEPGWAAPPSRRAIWGQITIAIGPLTVPPLLDVLGSHEEGHDPAPSIGMVVLLVLAFIRTARLLRSEALARAEVARSRRYFQKLADNSSDAVVLLDATGTMIDALGDTTNPARGRLPQPGEMQAWTARLSAPERARASEVFTQVLAGPGRTFVHEAEVPLPDGPPVWLSCRFTNLLDDPAVGGIVVSLSDVTARKQTELELEHARDAALEGSRAKSAFLATMSHEIRTPLNGVIGLTGLLLTTDLDERQHQYAAGVDAAGNALLGVINDILDFSKVEAGRLELEHIDFDLLRVVEEAADLVAADASAKGLRLTTSLGPDLPAWLRGDPGRLRQVLLNLLANAVKFTPAGEVRVSAGVEDVTAEGVVVRFEVTDTGIGIDPTRRDHLFEAFSQADSSTTRRYGGTGLGLAISRQLVTAMGGTIGADPRPEGGSTFWVSVPLPVAEVGPRARRPRAASQAPEAEATATATARRVLVVEDSDINQLVATGILEHLGYLVDLAENGAHALSRLEQTAYDAVLMDCQMPVMDGYEATACIRRDPRWRDLPVIAMTAAAIEGDRERCLAAGMDDYVTKPVDPEQLRATLQRWLPGAETATEPARPAGSAAHEDSSVRGA